MNRTIKDIIFLFVIIIFSNSIGELMTDSDLSLLKNPFKFLGIAVLLSIIGGIILNWVKKYSKNK